jgi:UDP-N-acetylglucosamine 4,6-dehydratase (inverting)
MNSLKGKTILLTGGTGSFGKKFTEIVLKECNPKVLRVFSRDEKKQLDMMNKFKKYSGKLRFFIGDVRDPKRLERAMSNVDIVVHAAALKQVPSCEYNPIEAVRTNIDGAINVIDAAIDNGIDKVMSISTDKAVYPANLYGGTKMTAEKLVVQGNSYAGIIGTKLSCVRYGNVIGSRGSVVPLFLEQKKEGIITITDERMTRFWLSIDQGVHFVINCIDIMKGGEVFVPKIPSMKLTDLADAIAPKAKKKIIGIRPGEKIHEVLLTEDEARHSLVFEKFFVIEPEHPFWSERHIAGGKKLPQGFSYSSDINDEWLTKKSMLKMIKDIEIE